MSIEAAKAFIERMKTDEEFARQVAAQNDPEEKMKFIKQQGFEFSQAEYKQATGEIHDESLSAVAGGMITGPPQGPGNPNKNLKTCPTCGRTFSTLIGSGMQHCCGRML